MKRSMKKMMAILLTLLMTLSVVACAAPAAQESAAPAEETAAPVAAATEAPAEATPVDYAGQKLVIWTNLTADAQYEVLSKQFAEVAKELGVEVEVEKVAFNEMYGKLAAAASSGEVPDIMHTNFGGTAYLYAADSITPLDDVINAIGVDDFSQAYKSVLTGKDGKIYGLPDWAMHTSVWYRKDLYEANGLSVPTTWAELLSNAEKLNSTDLSGFAVPLDGVQVAAQTLYAMMTSAGVYFTDPATGEYCFDKEKDEAIKVIDYLVELYHKASPAGSLTWSWGDYRNALAVTGTVAMTLDMGAVIGNAQGNNPDMVGKLGCFDFPGVDGKAKASFGSGYCFVASKQDDPVRTALVADFLKALYTPERAAERALSRPMFAFPSYKPAYEIYKASDKVADFQEQVDSIFNSFENGTWYWYGMEAGLSAMSAYIESTNIFGVALQGACDGTYTSEEAYNMINDDLMGFAGTM